MPVSQSVIGCNLVGNCKALVGQAFLPVQVRQECLTH
jgi:hypothetical protein